MKQKKAAVYCRVSSNKAIQLQSLKTQIEYYEEFFKKTYKLAGLYYDIASGIKYRKRVQFEKMIADCHKGKIDIIFTKSINRFSRNTVEFISVIRKLRNLGVDIFFENEHLLLSNERTEFDMVLLESVAQSESEFRSENIKWGLQSGFALGKSGLANRICYGYKKDENGNLTIDCEKAEVVKLIFKLYLEGYSLNGICKELFKRRISSPTGKAVWTSCAFDKILSNEKYTGNVLLQKTFVSDVFSVKQSKNNGEKTQYLYKNNHTAIIDYEVFEAVCDEKKKRSNITQASGGKAKRTNTRYSSGDTLSGKIQCCICGRNFRRITTHSGEIVWKCAGRVQKGTRCDSRTVSQNEIEYEIRKLFELKIMEGKSVMNVDKIFVGQNTVEISFR